MRRRFLWPLGLLVSCQGANLDSMAHNPVPCTQVDASTCEDVDEVWDRICVPCEEAYDWTVAYDWMDGTLEDGETVRPVETEVYQETLTTEDGGSELDFYFLPSHGESESLAQTTVVYNHGNFAGIEHYQPRMRFLHEAGYNVVTWDYRGYGKSLSADGESAPLPTAEQFMDDAAQVLARAAELVPDPDRMVVYGFSLGSLPAVEMATHEACALVLEAPFVSMNRAAVANAGVSLPEGFLSSGHYANDQKLAGISHPFFLIYGTEDSKFRLEDTEILYEAAAGPKDMWVLEGIGHGIGGGGIPEAGLSTYFEKIESFLSSMAPDCVASADEQ